MRIGLDAKRLFFNHTGLGNFSRTLLKHLIDVAPEHQYLLFSPKAPSPQEIPDFVHSAGLEIIYPKRKSPLWRLKGIVSDLKTHQVDVYHGMSHEIPIGLTKAGIPSVVTMHDLIWIPYLQYYPWLDRQLYQWKYQRSAKEATRLVAISTHTQRDLIQYFKVPKEKIEVIYQGIHPRFWQEPKPSEGTPLDVPDTYMLYVGSLTERKQAILILEAMAQIPEANRLPLVVVGKGKAYEAQFRDRIQQLRLEHWVYFMGFISDENLPQLYRRARMTIYPSAYEGFGLPIVESLACGTPVITTSFSALPEAGGAGALYMDQLDANALARFILELSQNEATYKTLQEVGREHARQFDNKAAARAYVSVYEEVGK